MTRIVLRLVTLAVCSVAASLIAAQDVATVKPADSDVTTLSVPSVTPAAAVAYELAPIPVATEDSTTFRKVPNIVCSDKVSQLVTHVYSKNTFLFDTCAEASKYQIFPFSGKLPTQEQIHTMATTKACTALFTACVLANLPQCDISELGLKAVTESLLKVTVDVDNGLPAPDTMRFHYMQVWRRDVNLAQAAGVPFGNDSQLYKEYSANLWTALTTYNVQVLPDLSIVYNATELTATMNGTALSTAADTFYFNTTATELLEPSNAAGSASVSASSSSDGDAQESVHVPSKNASATPTSGASRAGGVPLGNCAAAVALVLAAFGAATVDGRH